jgi:hypothetical protein
MSVYDDNHFYGRKVDTGISYNGRSINYSDLKTVVNQKRKSGICIDLNIQPQSDWSIQKQLELIEQRRKQRLCLNRSVANQRSSQSLMEASHRLLSQNVSLRSIPSAYFEKTSALNSIRNNEVQSVEKFKFAG